MPKVNVDYSKTIIYKLVCNDLNITECYVGSTTNFTQRKSEHKKNCINPNSKEHNCKKYCFIRDNGGWSNWQMVEIEKYPCNDKNEATKRERYYFELLNASLNTQNPNISMGIIKHNKEYIKNKDLYINNNENTEQYLKTKERIRAYKKEYYQKNRDKRNEYGKQYGKQYRELTKLKKQQEQN